MRHGHCDGNLKGWDVSGVCLIWNDTNPATASTAMCKVMQSDHNKNINILIMSQYGILITVDTKLDTQGLILSKLYAMMFI